MVAEAPTTSAVTVEICRKCGLSPNTFHPRRERFLESAKAAMSGKSDTAAAKALRRGE